MTSRRQLLIALGATALQRPLASFAQPAANVPRVGILDHGIPHLFAAFRESMRELGYIDGQNIQFDTASSQGRVDQMPVLAAELVRHRPDVIVTAGALPIRVVMRETATIPIVVAAIGDAVALGIVANLAQPVGNITGISFLNTELSAKRIEVLKEAVPRLRRVAVFNDLRGALSSVPVTEKAARSLGLQVQPIDVRDGNDLERGFDEARRGGADAVDVLASPLFNGERHRIVELAARNRLPTIYESREYVDAGGLISYGQNLYELFRRAAVYVDKILKGAKPTDLPWEQPTKIELVINLRTARSLGLTVPQALLLRADEVIQ